MFFLLKFPSEFAHQGLNWVFVTLKNRCAIGVGSRNKRYTRAGRLGLALAHLTRDGEVKKSRVQLCGC